MRRHDLAGRVKRTIAPGKQYRLSPLDPPVTVVKVLPLAADIVVEFDHEALGPRRASIEQLESFALRVIDEIGNDDRMGEAA
jgi:hypothetical protein